MRDAHINGTQLSRLSGISRSMVNKLRKGQHSPTLDMIVNLNAGLAKVDGHEILEILRAQVPSAVAYPEPIEPTVKQAKAGLEKYKVEPVKTDPDYYYYCNRCSQAHLTQLSADNCVNTCAGIDPVNVEPIEPTAKLSMLDQIKANLENANKESK